jgi:hypothetical protein
MAEYEFPGLRQSLIKNPSKNLCRLLERSADYEKPVSHRKVIDGLKNYYDKDVVAIYATNLKRGNLPNNYVNNLFVRGILDSVNPNESELIFKGPSGIIQPQGIEYKGSTWILPIDQLVDVVSISDYMMNNNPYNQPNPLKEFEFSTMAGERVGETVYAYDPVGAFLSIVQRYTSLKNELLGTSPTTPTRLKSIRITSLEEDIKKSGTTRGF